MTSLGLMQNSFTGRRSLHKGGCFPKGGGHLLRQYWDKKIDHTRQFILDHMGKTLNRTQVAKDITPCCKFSSKL